jgi:hypothetical protein
MKMKLAGLLMIFIVVFVIPEPAAASNCVIGNMQIIGDTAFKAGNSFGVEVIFQVSMCDVYGKTIVRVQLIDTVSGVVLSTMYTVRTANQVSRAYIVGTAPNFKGFWSYMVRVSIVGVTTTTGESEMVQQVALW